MDYIYSNMLESSLILFAVVSLKAPFKINIMFRPFHINLAAHLISRDGTDSDNGLFWRE